MNDRCYYCSTRFGPLEVKYYVREATKPKGEPNRWELIGKCCEKCSDKFEVNIK